jgi:predicted nucleic acid-binding protein
MIVLDTNVLSEAIRLTPSPTVLTWLRVHDQELYITAVCQAELLFGLEILPAGKRRHNLHLQIEALLADVFSDRILAFDEVAAPLFARIAASRRKSGRPLDTFDGQIAAIALAHRAAVATRNIDDFERCGLKLINPWNPTETYSN